MLAIVRLLVRLADLLMHLPMTVVRLTVDLFAINHRLGRLRYLILVGLGYLVFAVGLVYVVAPLRGMIGASTMGAKLRYDAERWMATAIYDKQGAFVGTFDPRLDSVKDVNYTDQPIAVGDYTANPDHKSIPVREVPDHYWRCLVHHEDRYLGTWLNPAGIDLLGVLKIPYSTVKRSIALKRPSLGVGGSTLPMQLARVIYNAPPRADEGAFAKLSRKFSEWWLAPVIYWELTRGGDNTALKEWTANHIWLAQRTGGQPLHGIETTSQIVFGKDAKDLTIAEQFVLAGAVNKPIILLEGNEKLNAVRLDRWRYITEVRARTCADALIDDEATKKQVLFELIALAGGPPDPKVKPKLSAALEMYAGDLATRAQANPTLRANALLPTGRLGLRAEMKQAFGYDWRSRVRGVTTTLDVPENLAFGQKITSALARIDQQSGARVSPGYALDPAKVKDDIKAPNVIVVAANARGEIVRYYDNSSNAAYFGSPVAYERASGQYDPTREARQIASTGKIIAAIAIANDGRDGVDTLYADTDAPDGAAAETCAKGAGGRRLRRALVAFACSANKPIEWRLAQLGQERTRKLIDAFGFAMPPAPDRESATPPTTAAVRGLIAGSPQRVHHMAAVTLAALLDRGGTPVRPPSLAARYDFTTPEDRAQFEQQAGAAIVPSKLIRADAHPLLRALLKSPLCHQAQGKPQGTLKDLAQWCADRRASVRLHVAKTGTSVTEDPDATVDTWVTGGVQFASGAAYSYVVMVGTGRETWARKLHATQVAAPLADVLLADLEALAKQAPEPGQLPAKAPQVSAATAKRTFDASAAFERGG